jgi:hypothetical protein
VVQSHGYLIIKMKITIDGIPAETKTHETCNGWRCEVIWMLQNARGASILGRGTHAQEAERDFMRRAEDDGQKIEYRID